MNKHNIDRERFWDEDRAAQADAEASGGYPPPDLFSPEELAQMEAEEAALNECYAADAAAEQAKIEALSQPENALAFLQEQHGDAGDSDLPKPVTMVLVLTVSLGRGTAVRAIVVCDDGVTRGLDAGYSYTPASYMDPPDGDAWFDYDDDVAAFTAKHEGGA